QIFQRVGQEDCTAKEISELLAHDPGLCAKILRTLNSAVYAQSRAVTSVQQAVTIMGMRPLRSLVLGLTLPVMQSRMNTDKGLQRFWMRSVSGAIIARDLIKHCGMPDAEDTMATTLLRDLGMILLRQTFQHCYDPIWLGDGKISADEQCDWEAERFAVHHAELSAELLDRWKLPIEMSKPIRFHHHPDVLVAEAPKLGERSRLLHFVSRLIDMEDGVYSKASLDQTFEIAAMRYKLKRESFEKFLAAVRPKVEEFSNILCVDIGNCPHFEDLLTAGCEEMVHLSLEASKTHTRVPARNETQAEEPVYDPDLISDPENIEPGSRLLQYEVIDTLGRGAMGVVLKAYDPGLQRHVAIKLLAPEMSGNRIARKRFALEARFAAALRHENVVAIHAVHEMDGLPILVMEFVPGQSLEDMINGGHTFSIGEIARISRQVALGLAAAHEARLVHRDVKPANILVERDSLHTRIADFGLARALDQDSNLSQPGLLLGTPNFMSPEQVDGKPLTPASDLFSLGSVLYTLCTSTLPFNAPSLSGLLCAVVEQTPMPIRKLNPAIPPAMAEIVEKLHAKKPADRFASAANVASSLIPWTTLR
ncbi:MAG TPA: HDOD domain-containing protein, partial [Gemmataceae bacterium]|nr:HDOD domain-containing protein [Gemmataceae bacterium]